MESSQVRTFFGLSPEPVIHADFDVCEGGKVFSSLDEEIPGVAADEWEVRMEETVEDSRTVIGLAVVCGQVRQMLFFSWQVAGASLEGVRAAALKLIGSVRSWARHESVLRAAETIRLLLSYLSLFGGCASGGGAGGAGNRIAKFSVSEARSRHGVFTDCSAERAFYVPSGRFPGSSFQADGARAGLWL